MKRETLLLRLLFIPPALLFLALAFKWNIIDLITPFLWDPLIGVLWILAITAGVISLIRKLYWPWWAFVAVVLCALFVPFTSIWLKANFLLCRAARVEIAQQVFSGKLVPNIPYNQSLIGLPSGWKYLSSGGGEVVVSHFGQSTGVYFYTFRGILGASSGYLFMNSDEVPHEADFIEVEKVASRWYWVQTE